MAHGEATNYYEILEVATDAPQHEIHKAYQRAKETYSQDNPALYSMFSPQEARELLRMIEEAYAVLGNQSLRRTYNETLGRSHSQQPGAANSTAPASGQSQTSDRTLNQSSRLDQSGASSSPASSHEVNQMNPANKLADPPASFHASPSQPAQAVAVQQKALPDFGEPGMAGSYSVRIQETPKPDLPPGTGRTSLSTFKVDEEFEKELAETTDFEGSILQKTRLYKNVSIERMSEATRISKTYLLAVETNDYKALPAAVFVRGFVVQMARLLGLDENKVAASYMKRFKAGGGK